MCCQGKPTDEMKEHKKLHYGELDTKQAISGAEILPALEDQAQPNTKGKTGVLSQTNEKKIPIAAITVLVI